ncbi:MAG: DNA polymerase III subunit gamma/tau, partial [Sphingomonadaceae bacterium]|nr:DNA polymerase III subunit gamma/tau [Sphingomonadaceae bacterium]
VHMLSKNAFNALLKTLEEPPAHVKFIFATTEVQKVPITVLSRCQRFDLRRIPQDKLVAHFGRVAEAEGAQVEPDALELVARAAEGSVRDGLSILDQAISHGQGAVSAQQVRDMLGLSDRGRVRELMGALLAGDARGALDNLRGQYDLGVNPDMVMQELLELTHSVTRAKVAGATDAVMADGEREMVREWAERLSFPALHRLWQLFLKGLAEVQSAPLPIQAAEMALLRVVHASSLPDPSDLVRKLTSAREAEAPREETPPRDAEEPELQVRAALTPPPAPVRLRPEAKLAETVAAPSSFAALVELFDERREPLLAQMLHDRARLVRYAPPLLELNLSGQRADFAQQLMRNLELWTGERWTVTLSDREGDPTLLDSERLTREAERQAVLDDPAVKKLLSVFPNAELIDYGVDAEAAPASPGDDEDIKRA